MATTIVLQTILPLAASLYAENSILPVKFPALCAASPFIPALPKAYASVISINVALSSLVLIALGFEVAGARNKFKEKAIKNGDADAEARFSYPKLYAEGFSNEAKMFNCVQRGHQQPLETYTQFVALSLVGGIRYPVTVAGAGIVWVIARFMWAKGYATGEPSRRYDSLIARGVWSSLIAVLVASGGVAASIAGIV
jgi:glutathione S-transferase